MKATREVDGSEEGEVSQVCSSGEVRMGSYYLTGSVSTWDDKAILGNNGDDNVLLCVYIIPLRYTLSNC